MLVIDIYGDEFHLNPNHIVFLCGGSDVGRYVKMSNNSMLWPDDDSYERIVAWMEKHEQL